MVQLKAKDDDCGEYGDICSYEIETENQPFDIDGKGQSAKKTRLQCLANLNTATAIQSVAVLLNCVCMDDGWI